MFYFKVFEATLKEHRGKITSIKLRKDDSECISASTDGSCILWNLEYFIESFTHSVLLSIKTWMFLQDFHTNCHVASQHPLPLCLLPPARVPSYHQRKWPKSKSWTNSPTNQNIHKFVKSFQFQIGYWEIDSSNTPIREVDAAAAGNINGMDVGMFPYGMNNNYIFVTCGGDKLIKVQTSNFARNSCDVELESFSSCGSTTRP